MRHCALGQTISKFKVYNSVQLTIMTNIREKIGLITLITLFRRKKNILNPGLIVSFNHHFGFLGYLRIILFSGEHRLST